MKEYLKMADVKSLRGELVSDGVSLVMGGDGWFGDMVSEQAAHAASHAINSHDELVAEVGRLCLMISECYPYIKDKADWGNEYEVDLADRLFDAAK